MSSPVLPGSVVAGVDGSTAGDAAVVWAASYAAAHRRPPRLVHGAGALVVSDVGFDVEEARQSLLLAAAGGRGAGVAAGRGDGRMVSRPVLEHAGCTVAVVRNVRT